MALDWILVESDPQRGVDIYMKAVDPTNPDTWEFKEVYDVQKALDLAALIRELPQSKEMRHFMEVPLHIEAQALREGWHQDDAYYKKAFYNNSDYAYLRTWDGHI